MKNIIDFKTKRSRFSAGNSDTEKRLLENVFDDEELGDLELLEVPGHLHEKLMAIPDEIGIDGYENSEGVAEGKSLKGIRWSGFTNSLFINRPLINSSLVAAAILCVAIFMASTEIIQLNDSATQPSAKEIAIAKQELATALAYLEKSNKKANDVLNRTLTREIQGTIVETVIVEASLSPLES